MSVHSEIQNVLRNHSGDAALSIHGRQGDAEEGNSFFDMRAAGDPAPDEVLFEKEFAKEQDRARIAFLRRYFAILREELSPEEFKFFKLKFQTKKPEKLVAAWCGISKIRLFQKMRDKIHSLFEQWRAADKRSKENESAREALLEMSRAYPDEFKELLDRSRRKLNPAAYYTPTKSNHSGKDGK